MMRVWELCMKQQLQSENIFVLICEGNMVNQCLNNKNVEHTLLIIQFHWSEELFWHLQIKGKIKM